MNYNIRDTDNPYNTFSQRFTPPLWMYTTQPRVPEDAPYIVDLDFRNPPLRQVVEYYHIGAGDIFEVFRLTKRVLLMAVKVEVASPAAGLVIQPVTNSGLFFDSIDCSVPSATTYMVDGGTLNKTSDILLHSVIIDDPDYLGLKLSGQTQNLTDLYVRVSAVVSDTFDWRSRTNSDRDRAH